MRLLISGENPCKIFHSALPYCDGGVIKCVLCQYIFVVLRVVQVLLKYIANIWRVFPYISYFILFLYLNFMWES